MQAGRNQGNPTLRILCSLVTWQSQRDTKLAKREYALVKTTLDLPDNLLQRLKIRAIQERRPLKRLVADLLTRALESQFVSQPTPSSLPEGIELNERGFPVFRCSADAPAKRMTTKQLLALEQEILEEEDLRRAGIPL